MTINPLTNEQLAQLDRGRCIDARPFRILCNGKSVGIRSGDLVGGNVINHYVYWDCAVLTAEQIVRFLELNNPGHNFRIVYSKK